MSIPICRTSIRNPAIGRAGWPFFCAVVIGVACLSALPSALVAEEPQPVLPAAADSAKASPDAAAAPALVPIDDSDYELMKLFVDTLDEVERNYVKPISRRELMEAAIQGVLSKLDNYSNYIAPDDVAEFRTEVDNEFGGIGIRVGIEDDKLTVASPLKNTPADRAGLKAGDVIVEINGENAVGIGIENAVKKLRGPVGSSVTLTVITHNAQERREVELERDTIPIATVLGHFRQSDGEWDLMLDKEQNIGYLRISSFARHTTEDLLTAIEDLQKQGMQGLIIDLRFNPGGLLDSAIAISDLFLKEGRIVSTKGRNVRERIWDASPEGTLSDFPMAVLINRYSASASEILSACLQDHQRAIVVGERSWGKGSVQRVIDLDDGRSALKLTTASYYRPSGKNIDRDTPGASENDEWGVQPNDGYAIEMSRDEIGQMLDYQQRQMLTPRPDQPNNGDQEPKRPTLDDALLDKQLKAALESVQEQLSAASKGD